MKKLWLISAVMMSLAAPAWAKNFAFPKNNPVATVTIPDTWATDAIDYGFSAKSPDGDVFFSVESASAKNVDKLMSLNDAWMKENDIKVTGEAPKQDFNLGGLPATIVRRTATDANGDTIVEFVFAQAGTDRLIMMTLWASDKEREANAADIKTIQASIKTIN